MPRYSTIRLCVAPLDKTYKNTIWFDNTDNREIQRHNYFYSLPGQIFNNQSLCRINANTFRVQAYYEDLLRYNYMVFTNPKSEGVMQSREFYAFVDQINYINESTSEIVFTIDYLMTYMFDFKVQPSFVEREHSETDYMFEHHVEEGLDTGEYEVSQSKTILDLSDCYIGFACNIDFYNLPMFVPYGQPGSADYPAEVMAIYKDTDNRWKLKYGQNKSVGDGTWTIYWVDFDSKLFQYNYGEKIDGIFQGYTLYYFDTLDQKYVAALLAALSYQGVGESVKMIFPLPKAAASIKDRKALVYTESGGGSAGTNLYIAASSSLENVNASIDYTSMYGNNQKNNKVFCSPFTKLAIYNNEGGYVELKPEFMNNPQSAHPPTYTYSFVRNAVNNGDTTAEVKPAYYKGGSKQHSLLLSGFPLGSWGYSVFDNWYAQNRNSLNWQYAGAAVGLAASAGIAAATFGASAAAIPIITAAGNLAGGVVSVGKLIGSVEDKKVMPDSVQGQIGNASLNLKTAEKKIELVAYKMQDDYLRIVDDYFTMYGYASHEVKVPNIFASKGRPYFNYIKTQNVTLVPVKNAGNNTKYLSSEAINTISAILDNGITFWNCSRLTGTNPIEVGDYTVDNSPEYLETNNALEGEKEVNNEQE